jgi:uncharacterized protein
MTEPITQYVLKLHSRCDLACDHCYVYEHADQSWRQKPRAISALTAQRAAQRIAEHARAHQLAEVALVLHGGEPLLLGQGTMREVLRALTAHIGPVAGLDLRIHTNGVLLDERWCELFDEYTVRVGVSLDGNRGANDRHRRFADGRSSHGDARRALALLRRPAFRHLYAGILCTIDLRNDPLAVYEALVAEEPPRLDLLLPHATWESPPYRPDGRPAPYATWLDRIYRRWTRDGRPVPIRLFDSLISAASGGPSWSETVGLDPVDLLVIETDGSWEQPDSLKTAYHGAPATGLDVFAHPVDEVASLPGFVARQGGLATLSPVCQACPVVAICGGGLYAHRYRAGSEFNNPSVYCADLKALIGHVTVGPPAAPDPARARHELTAAAFAGLAAGPGDAAAVETLAQTRLSYTRSLVAHISRLDSGWASADLRAAAAEGWALLCALDREYPAAVRNVLAHPYTHAWALRCLRPLSGADADLDRAHLAGLAAAAAVHARVSARLPLPVRAGVLHLPTLGALQIEPGLARTAVASVASGQVRADGGGIWRPVRRVRGPVLDVTLEDSDPFRDCHDWPTAGRLTPAEYRAWQRGIEAAGSRLAATVPRYAAAIAAGLRSVVPLRGAGPEDRSSTARQAFGSVALGLPVDPGTMDVLLLHEFQHVKLHALTDLRDLFDPGDARLLPVPWRPDRRPVEGVLHGAYAHLALTHLAREQGLAARGRYRQYQSWVADASAALSATGSLTADGERFVDGMSAAAQAPADDD